MNSMIVPLASRRSDSRRAGGGGQMRRPEKADQLAQQHRQDRGVEQDQAEEQAALDDPAIAEPVRCVGALVLQVRHHDEGPRIVGRERAVGDGEDADAEEFQPGLAALGQVAGEYVDAHMHVAHIGVTEPEQEQHAVQMPFAFLQPPRAEPG